MPEEKNLIGLTGLWEVKITTLKRKKMENRKVIVFFFL